MKNAWSDLIGNSSSYFLRCEAKFPHFAGITYTFIYCLFYSIASLICKWLKWIPTYQLLYMSSIVSLCCCILTDSTRIIPKDLKTYRLLFQRGFIGSLGLVCIYKSLAYLPLSISILLVLMNPLWIGFL